MARPAGTGATASRRRAGPRAAPRARPTSRPSASTRTGRIRAPAATSALRAPGVAGLLHPRLVAGVEQEAGTGSPSPRCAPDTTTPGRGRTRSRAPPGRGRRSPGAAREAGGLAVVELRTPPRSAGGGSKLRPEPDGEQVHRGHPIRNGRGGPAGAGSAAATAASAFPRRESGGCRGVLRAGAAGCGRSSGSSCATNVPEPRPRGEIALGQELLEREQARGPRDPEVRGERPRRGQPRARRHTPSRIARRMPA